MVVLRFDSIGRLQISKSIQASGRFADHMLVFNIYSSRLIWRRGSFLRVWPTVAAVAASGSCWMDL